MIVCHLRAKYLTDDHDPKTYTGSTALLTVMCDFDFLFGLVALKTIPSNTNSLSKYLQGKTVDVITARKTATATKDTLHHCRNEEHFESAWNYTDKLAQNVKEVIQGTRFSFKEARVGRKKQVSRRRQALIGEEPATDVQLDQTAKDCHRISTYYLGLDKVIGEMDSRFSGNDQDILCALGSCILNSDASDEHCEKVASQYGVDHNLLKAEKAIYSKFLTDHTPIKGSQATAADVVSTLYNNDLHVVLPVFNQVANILATTPATSCSAERSFSALRRMKTYLRSTMGQTRLNSLAILNTERKYSNMSVVTDVDQIIDIFASRKGRKQYLF